MFWNENNQLHPHYQWAQLPALFRKQPALIKQFYQELFNRLRHLQANNFAAALYQTEVWAKINDPQFWKLSAQPLFGLPYLVKDSFAVKGKVMEAGSKILQGFTPNYDAAVVTLLAKAGLVLVGKTNMDELGMGGTGLENYRGAVLNSNDPLRITGGSSSGSAVALALNLVPFTIGTDTGNSVRLPASFMGIIGFKPTFGAISRFGLVPYSPNLDTVGIFACSLAMLEQVFQILCVFDARDFAMQKIKTTIIPRRHPLKIGVLGLDPQLTKPTTIQLFRTHVLPRLANAQFKLTTVKLDYELTSLLFFLYQVLSFPDALSSQANLTGFTFGLAQSQQRNANFNFETTIIENRTAGFGFELKKRYVIGAYYVDRMQQKLIYEQALQLIQFLKERWQQKFAAFDCLIHPAAADIAPTTAVIKQWKIDPTPIKHVIDDYLLITNFLGWPSLVIPFAKQANNWIGYNLFAKAKTDFRLIQLARLISQSGTTNNAN